MRNIKIYATLFLAICILPSVSFGQTEQPNTFYNAGAIVHIQPGALLHVQGDFANVGTTPATVTNNGVLNVEGNFTNAGVFTTDASDGTTKEATVRFVGNSVVAGATSSTITQTISVSGSGTLNSSGTSSFYNLVVDQGVAGSILSLATPITVDGSLVWGGSTAAASYTPSASSILSSSSLMKVQGSGPPVGNGIIQMYNGSNDYGITISNAFTSPSSTSGIYMAGYQPVTNVPYSFGGNYTGHTTVSNPIASSTAKNDQYLQSRGADGATAGLTMTIHGASTAGVYTLPLGGPNRKYNPIQINLESNQTATSGVTITGKFTEYTTGTSAFPGTSSPTFPTAIDKTNSQFTTAEAAYYNNTNNSATIAANEGYNPGYAVYQPASCETGTPSKWFIADQFLTSAGYWTITNTGTLTGNYTIQSFPQGYTESTASFGASKGGPNRRLVLQNGASFSSVPSVTSFYTDLFGSGTNVVSANANSDILKYSYLGADGSHNYPGVFASTTCTNDATGIPGGEYSSFGHFGIITSSVNTGESLPVDLISLSADPINNTFIMVSWATASEQQNKGFQVQRSIDGINFTTIGWVDGHGTTDEQNNYSYNDNTVEPNVVYYYRLNQEDINGNSKLTYIVSAEITAGPSITVSEWMPNPTTGAIRLVVNTTEQLPISVRFYDMLGKMVISSNNEAAFGTNTFDFDLGSLTDGTYTASIRVGTNTYSKKVVLVK